MDIHAPRSTGKLVFSLMLAGGGIIVALLCLTVELKSHHFTSFAIFSLLLMIISLALFLSYFRQEVVLHADEQGIFTMYQFYLPWEYIDCFYTKELENGAKFVEIKLIDNKTYINEMDRDAYTAYYDEIEMAQAHGHEMFYFPVSFMELDDETVINFLTTARKIYSK